MKKQEVSREVIFDLFVSAIEKSGLGGAEAQARIMAFIKLSPEERKALLTELLADSILRD